MLKLYDLSGKNDIRFSPPCWNIKLCLFQNNIKFTTIPVKFTDKDKIALSCMDAISFSPLCVLQVETSLNKKKNLTKTAT